MDLIERIHSQNLLLIVIILLNTVTYIKSDCGFPSIPVHLKIRPLTAIYYEDDIVEYYCEFKDMKLIGGKMRQCAKSKWKGDIPQCVREIPRKSVDRIEFVDIKNHTISKVYNFNDYNYYRKNDYERYQLMTFYGDYNKGEYECIKAKNTETKPSLEWKVYFKTEEFAISYIEIVINNNNLNGINTSDSKNVIKDIFVNNYRECKPISVTKLDINGNSIKYGFLCDLKNSDSNLNEVDYFKLKYSDVSDLQINFAVNEIIVCELHVYRSFISLRSACGSPDIPLHSNYTSIIPEDSSHPIGIGFKFTCDDGFELKGNPAVICGLNSKWLDTFPTCLPKNTCELLTKESIDSFDISVDYQKLYSSDGNITAIDGSQAIYSCSERKNNGNNKTLIGDSIRFCQLNGSWTGEQPACVEYSPDNSLDYTDFTIFLSEINEDILKTESILPKFAHYQHRPYDCGIPAIPVYSKVYTPEQQSQLMVLLEDKVDLMPTYPNGSVIRYHCESRFTFMANDFEERVCVNGSWTGTIGKCYLPIGGTDAAKVASISAHENKQDPRNYYNNYIGYFTPNASIESEYWNFIETAAYDSSCATFGIKKGQKQLWSISLTHSVRITYFSIRFETSRIFHSLEEGLIKIHKSKDLKNIPIRAELPIYYRNSDKIVCEITKVIEAAEWITQISFKCDDSNIYSNEEYGYDIYQITTSTINLFINSDAFHESFNSTNITMCGLILFQSPNDCGSPESVPNSDIVYDHNSFTVRYHCHNGFKMSGSGEVRCGRNGRWLDKFPRCELYKLCDLVISNTSSILRREYYNTLKINGEEVAVLGSLVKYSCQKENVFDGKHILIGPRIAVCTASGKWSANIPICRDESSLMLSSAQSSSNPLPLLIIFVTIIIIMAIISLLIISYRFGCFNRISKLINNRRPISNSSTFISYGQPIRDSVISFERPNIPTITNNDNLIRI